MVVRRTESDVFHEGERAVQRRAGMERVAAQMGRIIGSWIAADFAYFLRHQRFLVIAAYDDARRVWASPLAGRTGFAHVIDDDRLQLRAAFPSADPLAAAFDQSAAKVGVLAIDFDTRTRIRINGIARRTHDGISVAVEEAFGNCPKFIQRRVAIGTREPARNVRLRAGASLEPAQATLITDADTFFIASVHPQRGADASHRGGRPGFVEVLDDGKALRFPDYAGNRMFQTLGNLTVDPQAGLLFLDWQTGTALQLTGRTSIVWGEQEVRSRPGAERPIDYQIEAVYERERAIPAPWDLIEASRLNHRSTDSGAVESPTPRPQPNRKEP